MVAVEKWIQDDLEALLDRLPPRVTEPLKERDDLHELLEVILDLGRSPEARFPSGDVTLDPTEGGGRGPRARCLPCG